MQIQTNIQRDKQTGKWTNKQKHKGTKISIKQLTSSPQIQDGDYECPDE